jgi:hypothetical protein
MSESDDAEEEMQRLAAALDRIEQLRRDRAQPVPARLDPAIANKLDSLIRAIRSALDH